MTAGAERVWTLPNIITIARICFTPVIALLPFIEGYRPKLVCFVLFVVVALTDVLDGYLARSRQQVTDLGKLLDPIADKLIGREVAMTLFRWWAQHRGVIIAAGSAGKLKALLQNVFVGAVILWFAFRDARKPMGWEHNRFAVFWNQFHGSFVAVTMLVAVVLTVYSFVVYVYRNRALFNAPPRPPSAP